MLFLGHALKRAAKSFGKVELFLIVRQMKHDSNVRQGQLQDLFDAWGEAVTDIVGLEGTKLGKVSYRHHLEEQVELFQHL